LVSIGRHFESSGWAILLVGESVHFYAYRTTNSMLVVYGIMGVAEKVPVIVDHGH
jgi:hypothetical protein